MFKVDRAVRLLGYAPPVAVDFHWATVCATILEVLHVIADGKHHLVGHKPLLHEVEREQIGHLLDHQPPLVEGIRVLEHLPDTDAVARGLVCLDFGDCAGLPAPGVVDEKLGVDAEQAVERVLVCQRPPCHIAHRPHPVLLQPVGVAVADAPEVSERAMRPEAAAVGLLVQFRDADAVLVGGYVLRHDVHRHLGEIEVCADARRGCNASLLEDALDEPHRELMGRQAVHPQILRGVDEHLVDGIDVDVVRRDVPHVDGEDVLADLHVPRHSRRRDDVAEFQCGVRAQFGGVARLAREAVVRRVPQSHGVRLTHLLHDLEEPRPSGDAAGLQRRRDRQADGLLRP